MLSRLPTVDSGIPPAGVQMKATKEEMSAERELWADVYRFRMEYFHGEDGPEFWRELVDKADELCKKHGYNTLACALIKACVDDVERSFKSMNRVLKK